MAAIETSVYMPGEKGRKDEVYSEYERQPEVDVKQRARLTLERQIRRAQTALDTIDQWTVVTHRGNTRILSYEEMETHG